MHSALRVWLFLIPAAFVIAPACSDSGDSAAPPAKGGSAGADASVPDGATGGGAGSIIATDGGDGAATDGLPACGDSGCANGAVCKYGTCVSDLGTCATHDDCPGDSYCDADKTCVPYGVPPGKTQDPECERPISPDGVKPTLQCEWAATKDASDPTAAYTNVYTAPMVADLNLDLDPNKLQPSVVLTTFGSVSGERVGVLRVFDGRTCEEQMRIGGPDDPEADDNRPGYGTQWAIGDLDNDVGNGGHPEIVGVHRMPGAFGNYPAMAVIAFGIDSSVQPPKLVRRWHGRDCSSNQIVSFGEASFNYGPGLWDLDDDGKPEVVLDSMVFDSEGCLLNAPAQNTAYLRLGVLSTIADVDLDDKPDLVRYDGIYGWNTTAKKWELKPWFVQSAAQLPGHVAVADLGSYSMIPGKTVPDGLPEVIVVSAETSTFQPQSSGTIRVQDLTGKVVFGPVPLHKKTSPYGGHGGPPTASDFDGDGQVEFAAAANEFYVVYDPDCQTGGAAAKRPGGKCVRTDDTLPPGVLWAQPSQDFSSSSTGSSIFDFNGDGKAEAVHADECYVRVYEGDTGKVIFSAPASSGTGYELPVICDVDGDFSTEIVVSRASNSPDCPANDPLFPTSATFEKKAGFAIYRDPEDLWAASRPIWNQHAYSITNVTDEARIPKSSQVLRNWEQPGLNNFRQNTQGSLGKLALADLTVELDDIAALCAGQAGSVDLDARVCNRGTNPVQDGVSVEFYAVPKGDGGAPDAAGSAICSAITPKLLAPGECVVVTCTGDVPGDHDVYVVVDPQHSVADCHPGNNDGASALMLCTSVK